VPSSEALLQLAIFDLILLLDECYSFQIMTEGRQMAYQLSQGVPAGSSLPQAFMATFPYGRCLLEKTNLCLRN
jgi:hypothetical protein